MLRSLASEWKYALAQKLKSATAVHLPFNKLEPAHLSFNLSIAPALFYRRQHRVVALLYKHFEGKEALYAQLEEYCVEAHAVGDHLFDGATPSTETLVVGVALLVQAVFLGVGARESHEDSKRLVTSSLLGDGQFAKAFSRSACDTLDRIF